MVSPWPKPFPAYYYLAIFFGSLGAGVFIVWWNNIWESIPFWMVIIKMSVFQTLFMFSTINAYRFLLWNEQNEEMCEKSSTV